MSAIRVSNDVQGHSRLPCGLNLKSTCFTPSFGHWRQPHATRHQRSNRANEIHHLSQASQPRISTQVPCQTPRPESNSDKPETLDHYCRKVLLTYHESQQRAPPIGSCQSSTRLAAVALFPGPRTRAASEPSAHATCTRLRFDITDRPATMALISPVLPCH